MTAGREAGGVVADIAKLSVGREEYYTRELATDHEEYLSGHGESPGRWSGAGASSQAVAEEVGDQQAGVALVGVAGDQVGQRPAEPSDCGSQAVARLGLPLSADVWKFVRG